MRKILFTLVLIVLTGHPVFGQNVLTKKFEFSNVHPSSYRWSMESQDGRLTSLDANNDGNQDLFLLRPDDTGPNATMTIITDPSTAEYSSFELQMATSAMIDDGTTPFIGVYGIDWGSAKPGSGATGQVIVFAGEGLYLYFIEDIDNIPPGLLLQVEFSLDMQSYRFLAVRDVDGDDKVDFVMINTDTRTLEIWGT